MLRVFVSSPKILSFFNMFEIQAYGLFFVIGLFSFLALFLPKTAQRIQVSKEKLFYCVVISLCAGIVGARLFYVLEFPALFKQGLLNVINPQAGGLSLLGGLFVAPIAGLLACRFFKVSFVTFFDYAALYVPIFDFFGRIGCFFGGCCYGVPTKFFFSVMYLDGAVSAPLNVDLLPIQLFTALLFFCLFIFMYVFRTFFLKYPGSLTFLYFSGAGFIRFFTDFFREDRSLSVFAGDLGGVAISVTWYQIISLTFAFFSVVGVFVCLIRAKKSLPLERL